MEEREITFLVLIFLNRPKQRVAPILPWGRENRAHSMAPDWVVRRLLLSERLRDLLHHGVVSQGGGVAYFAALGDVL